MGLLMQIYDHILKHTGILLNTIAVDTRTNMQMVLYIYEPNRSFRVNILKAENSNGLHYLESTQMYF